MSNPTYPFGFAPARPIIADEYKNRNKNPFICRSTTPLLAEDFGFALAQRIVAAGDFKDRNLVFSPLSFRAALSLVAAGSGGPTKDQLLYFLQSESSSRLDSLYSDVIAYALADGSNSGGPKLSFANGLWVDQSETLKTPFKRVVENVYNACISQVDFKKKEEACREVNSWIEEKTEGLIKDVIDPSSINSWTRLVIANALYFKGLWANKFEASRTCDKNFYLLDGSSVKVPFMTNSEKQAVCAYDGFKVLRLPYEHGSDTRQFSMYLLLPDAKDGLPDLTRRVCSQSGFLESHIPRVEVNVGAFWVPKFKISFKFEASEVLKVLGLVLPFGGGLTEMVDTELVVSKIVHEAFVEVDELGTEAAATTTVLFAFGCARFSRPEPLISFVADHPFMYVIREDTTGAALFIGQVLNPAQKN